jgi:hypothetical protein
VRATSAATTRAGADEGNDAVSETAPTRPDTSDMAAVHNVFRSALAAAPDLVAGAAGSAERRGLIANFYTNIFSFLEVHHDGEEELIFPLLAERAPTRGPVVEEARAQHADVIELLDSARSSVAAWEVDGDGAAPDVVRSLQALGDALTRHLDDEEAYLVPLAGEHLTAEEWGVLPGNAMGHFSGDKVWLVIGLVRENFTQAQRDMMLEKMPPPALAMWQTMGEASFDDLIGRVRSTN